MRHVVFPLWIHPAVSVLFFHHYTLICDFWELLVLVFESFSCFHFIQADLWLVTLGPVTQQLLKEIMAVLHQAFTA